MTGLRYAPSLRGAFVCQKIEKGSHRGEQTAPRRKYGMDDFVRRPPIGQHRYQPSRLYIVPDHQGRQPRDPGAGEGSLAQRRHIVGDEPRPVAHLGNAAVGMG